MENHFFYHRLIPFMHCLFFIGFTALTFSHQLNNFTTAYTCRKFPLYQHISISILLIADGDAISSITNFIFAIWWYEHYWTCTFKSLMLCNLELKRANFQVHNNLLEQCTPCEPCCVFALHATIFLARYSTITAAASCLLWRRVCARR